MARPRLFHASDQPNIGEFLPRPVPSPDAGVTGNAVWALDETHLPNYLFPRDCPRVCFAASEKTSVDDRACFLSGGRKRVIAVESGWKNRISACEIYLYEFSPNTFELVDAGAGYYISREAAIPIASSAIKNLMTELSARNIELRFLPNLWELRNQVIASTLEFSVIRFRNAQAAPV